MVATSFAKDAQSMLKNAAYLLDNVVFSDDKDLDHTILRELDSAPAGLCTP